MKYNELRAKQQEEVNNFPFIWAFSDEQFEKGMREKFGLNAKEKSHLAKICSIGCGGYVRKDDVPAMREMFARHRKELRDLIAKDKTGEGFIFDMFCTELFNHEYGYTGHFEDTRTALGLSIDEINESNALRNGLKLATEYVVENTIC